MQQEENDHGKTILQVFWNYFSISFDIIIDQILLIDFYLISILGG